MFLYSTVKVLTYLYNYIIFIDNRDHRFTRQVIELANVVHNINHYPANLRAQCCFAHYAITGESFHSSIAVVNLHVYLH